MADGKTPLPRDGGLAHAAAYINGYRAMAPWAQSTGFRTSSLRYRTLTDAYDPRIAEEFLVNTRHHRSDPEDAKSVQAYFSDAAVVVLSLNGHEEVSAPAVALPAGIPPQLPLSETLARRRSIRVFTGDPMPLNYLATLVRSAAAITASADVQLADGGTATIGFRSTPSAGGLYPVDLYVAALKVEGLGRGIYRYDPVRDLLAQAGREPEAEAILGTFTVQDDLISLSRANAIFLFVGRPWKSMRKYGRRGLRYLFHEVGGMSEHIHLAAVSLGIGSVDCASYCDDEAHLVLGIDGQYEALLHTLVVGTPA